MHWQNVIYVFWIFFTPFLFHLAAKRGARSLPRALSSHIKALRLWLGFCGRKQVNLIDDLKSPYCRITKYPDRGPAYQYQVPKNFTKAFTKYDDKNKWLSAKNAPDKGEDSTIRKVRPRFIASERTNAGPVGGLQSAAALPQRVQTAHSWYEASAAHVHTPS